MLYQNSIQTVRFRNGPHSYMIKIFKILILPVDITVDIQYLSAQTHRRFLNSFLKSFLISASKT